jgi:predicted ATPase
MTISYLDFDVEIRAGSGAEYLVVARSPAGEAYSTLKLPFAGRALELLLESLQSELRGPAKGSGGQETAVQEFGRTLFDTLISADVRTLFDVSAHDASREGKGLRLKLRVQPPELGAIPWEFLYDTRGGEFVCLSRDTPLVRYLELTQPPVTLRVSTPLRILGLIASPKDQPPLNVEREKQLLEQTVAGLKARGLVELHWLDGQTWGDLQRATWSGPWHVFHFIGHGEFERESGEGFILLEDSDGLAYRFSSEKLARLLGDHEPLRLALLNACEGACASSRDTYSSTAAVLVRRGVPAVLAMQYQISDQAAMDFAQSFYAAIAHGLPVDAAVAEARKAISLSVGETAEWAIPVLYMRSPDGVLFDVTQGAPVPAVTPLAPAPQAAAPAQPASPPNNLPAELTPLIGREREVAAVQELLLSAGVRLLTLVGPGGSGKTRLGLEVAVNLADRFEHGVFFVSLAELSDPNGVLPAIARTLGLPESDQPPAQALKEYLRERQMLLLIDNFEQVLGAGPLLSQLLAAAPRVEIMVTSRAPLRVSGEQEFPVEPLELPDLARLPSIPDALMRYAAVMLFVTRARAVRPNFQLTPENMAAVAEICVRLDGLPLALELAAARSKLFTPQAMLQRLDSRMKLLTGGARDLPERQQTLRGAIDWSYNLLDPRQQMLFARLGVFVGGCVIEAAETICNADGQLVVDVIDGLTALVDNSLVRQSEDQDGEPRFTMLETIREYAVEKLEESGAADALRQAHAAYFLAYAEAAEPELSGDEQALWLDRLDDRSGNLRAAIEWSVQQGDAETALRIGGAIWRFWWTRGYGREGRRLLDAGLAIPQAASITPAVRANALNRSGWLSSNQGDYQRARASYEEALVLYRSMGEEIGVARALNNLAELVRIQNDLGYARTLYEEGLIILRRLGHTNGLVAMLCNLGVLELTEHNFDLADRYLTESYDLANQNEHMQGAAIALANRGYVAQLRGDPIVAQQFYRDSILRYQQLEDLEGIVDCLEGFAWVAEVGGRTEQAARLWGAAAALREQTGTAMTETVRDSQQFAIDVASAQIDPAAWQAAWAEGRALSVEQAVALALEA